MAPLITIAVPSFNQGRFLEQALASIFDQDLPVEVFVADAGSSDETMSVLERWASRLAGWRSHADAGQAAAINEFTHPALRRCIEFRILRSFTFRTTEAFLLMELFDGKALDVRPPSSVISCVNIFIQAAQGLKALHAALDASPSAPAAYGRAWNYLQRTGAMRPVWVEPFSEKRLAWHCIVSQPATLIRRAAWDSVRGLDETLHMALDYDLWWRLYRKLGPLRFVDAFVAVNREHELTKTSSNRRLHYREAMAVVRRYHGRLPWKWWLAQPYSVWLRGLLHQSSARRF